MFDTGEKAMIPNASKGVENYKVCVWWKNDASEDKIKMYSCLNSFSIVYCKKITEVGMNIDNLLTILSERYGLPTLASWNVVITQYETNVKQLLIRERIWSTSK